MLSKLFPLSACCVCLLASPALATQITWGVSGGVLANGELDLGSLDTNEGQTFVNPGGAGFDIVIDGNHADSFDPENPPGTVKTNGNNAPTISIEFFNTGTTDPVDVSGLRLTFGDIDSGTTIPLGNFTIASGGATSPLELTGVMTFGANLSANDQDGDTVKDDVLSTLSVSGNEFQDSRIRAVLDMGSTGISKITFHTMDYVHFGNGDVADMQIIPEPSTLALAVLGLSGLALCGCRGFLIRSKRRAPLP